MPYSKSKPPQYLGLPSQPGDSRVIRSEGPLDEEAPFDFAQYPKYEYLPIQAHQIRLITLRGGRSQAPLRCQLKALDFAKGRRNHNYSALSYSWGIEKAVHPILIEEDNSLVQQLHVRPNLYRALRRLRAGPSVDIQLWVDALCINQSDNEEKTHQLPKMLMIYHSGANTVIWLGESNPGEADSERGIQFVEDIISIGKLKFHLESRTAMHDWLAFAELLTRDWFSRRWIIQEVAASRLATIRFGGIEIKWCDFVEALEIFLRSYGDIQKFCMGDQEVYEQLDTFRSKSSPAKALVETTVNVFRHWEGTELQSRWPLERLVLKLNRFLVTDPRDTIYAVLGLANDNVLELGVASLGANKKMMVGNYSKKPLEVYIDFFQYAVLKSRSLDILVRRWASPVTSRCEVGAEATTLPSWIGIVDASRIEGSFIGEPGRSPYKACSDTVAQCPFDSRDLCDGIITADGVILGAVKETSGLIVSLDDVWNFESFYKVKNPIDDKKKVPGYLWRTLVGDRTPDGENSPRWYQRACLYWLTHASEELELVAAYKKRVKEVVVDRKLFTYETAAESKPRGIGPIDMKPGDLVCILFGCSVPVILGEYDPISKTYKLIGECYVHAKMEGEHFWGLDQESIAKQTSAFKIR
ncbi:HET-domain-containing protein [Hyaloscypha hepaticicola]|uniref:HET-domain-containing protein n=1 Tax=Hyaloscypha hepaticicola TaxID=2082293 RepID=A0A2J6QEH7_9HELO|nr:HET-domain-containing protein [Hyaloscypha hepaticicola]